MTKARSAKGRMIDFDLLKIRQKLSAQPVTVDVKAREDFIDKKLRRRMRKTKIATAGPIDIEAEVKAPVLIDPPKPAPVVTPVVTPAVVVSKQKHRPPVK